MQGFKALNPRTCIDALLAIERPAILMHVKPDGDTVGSAMGLFRLLSLLGKSPRLLCQDPIPERLEFILKGESLSEYEETMQVIAIDVASRAQMGDLGKKIDTPYLMIDHHEVGEPFADYYRDPDASSAAEALLDVIEVLEARGLVKMNSELAYPVYTAICSDTGSFAFSNTRAKTHLAAARLMETGIDTADINRRLFASKSLDTVKAESFTAEKLVLAGGGKIAYASVSRSERDFLGLPFDCFEGAIEILRSVKGVEVAFIVKENDRGEIKASLRSTGRDVARIAAGFGGGGHVRAAGCTLSAASAEEGAEAMLKELLK